MRRNRLVQLTIFGFLFFSLHPGHAAETIHFQGRLTDAQGRPITGDRNKVTFSLYYSSIGADLAWPGPEQTVETNEAGLFSTDIAGIPSHIFSGSDLYLQVAVLSGGNQRYLKPRQKLTRVPYAVRADFAPVADDAVTSSKIKDGEVTSNDLAPSSVDSSHIVDGSVTQADLSQPLASGFIPSGAIIMFSSDCPRGWTRFDKLDHRFPLGSASYGTEGGNAIISGLSSAGAGDHFHKVKAHSHEAGTLRATASQQGLLNDEQDGGARDNVTNHTHPISGNTADASPDTLNAGEHVHRIDSDGSWLPPYLEIIYCQKD